MTGNHSVVEAVEVDQQVEAFTQWSAENQVEGATEQLREEAADKLPHVILLTSLIVFGCFPRLLTDKIKPVTEQIVRMANAQAGPAVILNSVARLTLTLRESRSSSQSHAIARGAESSDDPGAGKGGRLLSPLFEKEGQREAERAKASRGNQRLLTSAAAKSE